MATRHSRIGVTRDVELASALESTRDLLGAADTRSEAGHVRKLALLGARSIASGDGATLAALDRGRVLARAGARPASHHLANLDWLDEEAVDEGRRTSRTLEWARGGQ